MLETSKKEALERDWIDRFKRHRIVQPHTIDIDFHFSPEQFEKLKKGFTPKEMEDKWGIYYSSGAIYFHRSWSHLRIYKAKLTRHGDGYTIKSFDVERNQKTYRNTDDNEDIAIFTFLVANLLGIDARSIFASSGRGESGALQIWSTFGSMFFREENYPD